MDLKNEIDKLDWCPDGDAKKVYDKFIAAPVYDDEWTIIKLIMCLIYEKQYDDAIQLALGYIEITQGDCSHLIYFFCGISYDLSNNREKAVWAYKKVLQYDRLPVSRHDQFGISFSRKFVEYLLENPYSFGLSFEYNFEDDLKKQLPVADTAHFTIYYYPDSTAEKEIEIIKTQRENAYKKIAEYCCLTDNLKVNLYFFEDGNLKTDITGHTGAGWAYGRNMVEIYNEETKVNPYHELVHIITNYMYGSCISALSEGLAVYLCNLFNDMPAIDIVNDPYDEKIREFHKNGDLFALKDLLFLNIGESESKPYISYPQAASFVEYTMKKLGKNKFISLYTSLSNSDNGDVIQEIENAYNQKIEDIEKDWLDCVL